MSAFTNTLLRSAGASSLGLSLLAGAPALAQEQAGGQRAAIIDEIIVTAQKREESLQDVPVSISVVGDQQLQNLHVTQLTDIAAYVPGLQVTSSGTPGQTTISLRGIAPIAPGATVGTYIDETPLGSSALYQRATLFALDLLPYDIERIEVLRGPQGTLYGAGAMGGLLKYVARDPDLSNREFRLGGGLSDVEGAGDLGQEMRVSANLPLVEGRFAVRASYARNEIPGFIDNAPDGRKDVNDGTQESARVAMLWQASDAVSLKLTAMQQSIDSDNNAFVALDPATRRPLFGDLQNVLFVDERFRKDIDFYSATLNWDLGWADFTSASGYSDVSTDQRQDATFSVGEATALVGLPPGISFFGLGLNLQKFTQELRLTSKTGGSLAWQVGAFYTEEDADNSQIVRLLTLGGAPVPILDPLAVIALPSDYQELAVFGNASYKFTDRFELGAGVRFSRDDQDFAQIVSEGMLLPIGTTTGGSQEDVFTWSLSPKFQLTDAAMLYARIATGYQPGGPNVAVPGVPPSVDAATLTSYEVGLKSDFVDRRVLFDLAVYYIDWKDIQISASTPDDTASFLVNGGKAISQGIELSTTFKLTERLRLALNGAYTDATVSDDVPSLGGLDGDNLPYIPEISWSATADYSFPLAADWNGLVGGGFRWVGNRKTSLDSNPDVLPLDSYNALDLNAAIANDRWTIRAYAKNLTDERAYLVMDAITGAFSGVTNHLQAAPIQPRTWGIGVDFTF